MLRLSRGPRVDPARIAAATSASGKYPRRGRGAAASFRLAELAVFSPRRARSRRYFDAWVRDFRRVTPFVGSAWTHYRFVGTLRAFARALARELAPAALHNLADAYSDAVRRELALPPRRSRATPPCPEADATDALAAVAAARIVADEFRANFRPELRPLYLSPFLETALSRAPRGQSGAALWADVLDFVDACLLSP